MPTDAEDIRTVLNPGARNPGERTAGAPQAAPVPDEFRVLLRTTQGPITLELKREWAPFGVERFHHLVCSRFYDGASFFRVRDRTWAQFGIPPDPELAGLWRQRTISDDPRRLNNVRGTVSYAFKDPDGRSTQAFINLRDNRATHDDEPFVPFARVIDGMDVADSLFSGYGESSGGGIRAGRQDVLFACGGTYLEQNFPDLDRIITARVV